jgi:Skp family chaperone for outer membrane proteins
MKLYVTAGLGLASALALSTAAMAQTPPPAAPAAAAPVASGPVIAGVCTLSKEYAVVGSAVGQSVGARMKQLTTSVEAELKAEGTALESEKRTLESQRATMQQDALEQRILAFNQRYAAFQRKQQVRGQELQATQAKQIQKIAEQLGPILEQVYKERNCGLMLDRDSLILANPTMDVTQLAVTRLNAKITTLSFERERLDQPQAAGAAPRPAAPAPAAAPKK